MNRFLPGNGGGGRPRGSRNRLQSSFLNALARDFEEHGEAALKCCRLEDPSRHIAIIAALMPKDLLIGTAAQELEDDQIDELIFKLRERLAEHKAVPLPTPKTIEAKCG